MIHITGKNRKSRRTGGYLDHPAYIWAIESDWPQAQARLLAHCLNTNFPTKLMENRMGNRLTFTKFNNCKIYGVSDKAIFVTLPNHPAGQDKSLWIARSNIRSDDDRRMGEIAGQLAGHEYVSTTIHIVDWLVRKEGWKP